MKLIVKLVVIIAVLVAIFGTATVKGWIHLGTDKAVDAIEYGADRIKSNVDVQEAINNAKESALNSAKDAIGNLFSK